MQSFRELSRLFEERTFAQQFPEKPERLYQAAEYILSLGGKKIRPVLVLMANQLFGNLNSNSFYAANAIELFHNFTLIHDDIMDRAPVRRSKPTVHKKFDEPTALLAGDVMLVKAYEELNKIDINFLHEIFELFNKTAKEVCEGQQLDLDFEKRETVSMDEYLEMISLKTSVLVGCCLQMGAILGGAGKGTQQHLYNFGKNLGIAFQIQDDYLDAFGDTEKTGKTAGGDILANKKTCLYLHALGNADKTDRNYLIKAYSGEGDADKINKVLSLFKKYNSDEWVGELKQKYYETAIHHLNETAVISKNKEQLFHFAAQLMQREF